MACSEDAQQVTVKVEPEEEPQPVWGQQHLGSDTSGWSEGSTSVNSATTSCETTDCWNPSSAAVTVKFKPDSQSTLVNIKGIKEEPIDYRWTGDGFHQSADEQEGQMDFKCDFTYQPGPSSSADCRSLPVDHADTSDSNERDRANLEEKNRRQHVEDSIDSNETGMEKDRRRHVCDVCFKAFLWPYELRRHKMHHSGQKPFVCDVCDKGFTKGNDLKRHRLIHTDHRQFLCDVCNKAFTQAGSLKMHRLIHTGQKPFVCDVCSKAFTQAGALKIHKLIHTGEKHFECDVCSKAFTRSTDLNRHRLIHTGHKQFMCDVCSKAFTLLHQLKTHKRIHKDERAESPQEFTQDDIHTSDDL